MRAAFSERRNAWLTKLPTNASPAESASPNAQSRQLAKAIPFTQSIQKNALIAAPAQQRVPMMPSLKDNSLYFP